MRTTVLLVLFALVACGPSETPMPRAQRGPGPNPTTEFRLEMRAERPGGYVVQVLRGASM